MSKLWTYVATAAIAILVVIWIIILVVLYEKERNSLPLPPPVPTPKHTGESAGTWLENLVTHDHQPQLLPAPDGDSKNDHGKGTQTP